MPKAKAIDMDSNVNIEAEGLFTDREEPRKAFWDVYDGMEDGDYEVLAYYGTGGIGKTTLLKKLGREMEEKIKDGKRDYMIFSFEGKPDKEYILYMISRQLMATNKGMTCPVFDTAFIRLLESSGKSVEKYENEMKKSLFDNPVLQAAIDIADDMSPIPGVSVAAGVLERVATFANKKITEKERTTGPNARVYAEIAYADNKDLRNKLHEYLRMDLFEHMAKRERPYVFFLDGYENFVDIRETGNEGMYLEADRWLKDPERGLAVLPNALWVLAGREQPHWDKDILPSEHMHRIGDLCEKDAVEFFRKAGVKEDVLVHELFDITNGTPAFMDMSVSTYRKISKERTPAISDFGKNTSDLAKRYFENMGKEMKKMICILAGLPNVWSRQMAEETARATGNEFCLHTLEEILSMSIVEKIDGNYRLHKTLRDVIANEGELVQVAKNQAALQIAKKIIESSDDSYRMGDIRAFVEMFSTAEEQPVDEDTLAKIVDVIQYETKMSGDYAEGESIYLSLGEGARRLDYPAKTDVLCRNKRNYALYKTGKYEMLLKEAIKTHELAKKSLDEDDPEFLDSISCLAIGYYAKGEYAKAVRLDERCYDARRRVLGEEHPDTLGSLNNLAAGYATIGEIDKALEMGKKCYELRLKVLGEEHPDTLMSLSNLAINYSNKGDKQKALELHKKCYEIRTRVLGEEHQDTIRSLHCMANGYSALEENDKALEIRLKVYEARVKMLGEDHPDTLASLHNLANSYSDLDDYDKELELRIKCYEKRVRVLGEEHPYTLDSLYSLANAYFYLKNNEKACELYEKCYRSRDEVLGEKDPDTLYALHNYARTCEKIGDIKKAVELMERCYTLRAKALGEFKEGTLLSLKYLAIFKCETGDSLSGGRLMQKCYEGYVELYGEESQYAINALELLAELYSYKGGTPQSVELFEKSYNLKVKVYGEEDVDTLDTLFNWATDCNDTGEKKKALKLYRKCYKSQVRVLGAENPNTRKTLKKILELSKIVNDFDFSEYYPGCATGDGSD